MRNEEGCGAINPCCSGVARCCGHGRGAAAEESPTDRILLLPPSASTARIEAFRQGLRELGYVEGKNIVIEYRYAEGKLDRLPELAAELVRLKVDVIVTGGSAATRAAKEATHYDSHCHGAGSDPLETGSSPAWRDPAVTLPGLVKPMPRR